MVKQYPDTIVFTLRDKATQDAVTGKWVKDPETVQLSSKCRAEQNGRGLKISGADGGEVVYRFACYMPKLAVKLAIGTEYTLTDKDSNVETGKILGAKNNQLNSVVWL